MITRVPDLLRPATDADRTWLRALVTHPEVAASLSVTAEASLLGALDRTLGGADDEGVVVVGDAAGVVRWQTLNRRSRIAGIFGLAIAPAHAGRGLGTRAVAALTAELLGRRGFHRVEAETYGFNDAAVRTFARAGFAVEGRRRAAYDRHGVWQDGVHLGRVAEDGPGQQPGPAVRASS
jgi:RimJ/RimL family protein N-acetyltransferase